MREPEITLRAVESGVGEHEYVEFWPAGTVAKGLFRCTACATSMHVKFVLPRCHLCGEGLWERAELSPFAGAAT
jgi:hypothetical protein